MIQKKNKYWNEKEEVLIEEKTNFVREQKRKKDFPKKNGKRDLLTKLI